MSVEESKEGGKWGIGNKYITFKRELRMNFFYSLVNAAAARVHSRQIQHKMQRTNSIKYLAKGILDTVYVN